MIKILFTAPKKSELVSLGIKLLTWAPYSHVALQVDGRVFHATADGSQWTTLEDFSVRHRIAACFEIILRPSDSRQLVDICTKLKGVPYDYSAVGGLALYRLAYMLGWKMKNNPLRNNAQFLFCSELAYEVLSRLKIVPKTKTPELLDPKRFLRYLEAAKLPHIKRIF